MRYFGMITTRSSVAYTDYALESFFRTTPFRATDTFLLIDNDGSYDRTLRPEISFITPEEPRSFAKNVNDVMTRASKDRADVFFLNNDLIFTERWIEPLLISERSILSPLSNREIQHESDGFTWSNALTLEDYLPRRERFEALAHQHTSRWKGFREAISLPFFCVKIPYLVYADVGPLDESFGRGGAEDDDYCLRALLKGCRVKYALQSYVLHFNGRSTWAGGENIEETRVRCEIFRSVFRAKWGHRAATLLMEQKSEILTTEADLNEAVKSGNVRLLAQRLTEGKTP